jgi:hypothetical protein
MSFNLARVVAVTAALSISACSTVACAPPPGDSVAQLETTMADGTAPASPATNVNDEALEACWQDVRDRAFNVEIHHTLGTAADDIDDGTALEAVTRALGAVRRDPRQAHRGAGVYISAWSYPGRGLRHTQRDSLDTFSNVVS